MNETQRAMEWIVGRDTGTSSQTIWSVMVSAKPTRADVPYDPDDFGRCYRLLRLIPEWRARLHLVAEAHPTWTALVREWDSLTEAYELVIAGADGWDIRASKQMYDRMKVLIDEGRLLAGWEKTGPNSWRGPSKRP